MTGPGAVLIGASFFAEGTEAAHVNSVLGRRSGPVGTAWATALAPPAAGPPPFVAPLAARAAPCNWYYQVR